MIHTIYRREPNQRALIRERKKKCDDSTEKI